MPLGPRQLTALLSIVASFSISPLPVRGDSDPDGLRSRDPRQRIATANRLAASGEAAAHLPELWEALRGELSDQLALDETAAYVAALVRGGADVEARLLAAVEANDHVLALRLANAWARVERRSASAAAGALAARLRDSRTNVRRRAAEALGAMAEVGAVAVDDLAAALRDGDALVRDRAAGALGRMGSSAARAVPALAAAIRDPEYHVQHAALRALGSIGPAAKEAVPALEAMRTELEEDAASRGLAVMVDNTLHTIGPLRARGFDDLWSDFAGGDPALRMAVITELRTLGPEEARRAFARLAERLERGDAEARRRAAQLLGMVGPQRTPHPSPETDAALEALVAALDDDDREVRSGAAISLGNFGELTRPHSGRWVEVLDDPDETVAALAAHGMAGAGPVAVPALLSFLADADRRGRGHAVAALRGIQLLHPGAIPLADLRPLLKDPDPAVRGKVAELLAGDLGADPEVAELGARELIGQLRSEAPWEAFSGLLALTRMGPPAVEPLLVLLADPSDRVRRRALACLGLMEPSPETAVSRLREVAARDPDPAVRRLAGLVLRTFRDENAKAELFEALGDAGFEPPSPP